MILFLVELWKIHQLCVLQVLKEKRDNSSKKSRKLADGRILYHDIVSECRDRIPIEPAEVMLQQGSS